MSIITTHVAPEGFGHLPISFYTVCDYYHQETIRRPNGTYVFHQILLVLDGTGILKYNGKTYDLKRECDPSAIIS